MPEQKNNNRSAEKESPLWGGGIIPLVWMRGTSSGRKRGNDPALVNTNKRKMARGGRADFAIQAVERLGSSSHSAGVIEVRAAAFPPTDRADRI